MGLRAVGLAWFSLFIDLGALIGITTVILVLLLGQSRVKGIAVKIDPARLRPSDVMELEGDPGKIQRALGWKVEIPFEQTLTELLDYWRRRNPTASR